jgi:low temperature requirement protein LtrA
MTPEAAESKGTALHASPTVSWFELFYDLVVVAAVGLTNDVFLADPTFSNAALSAMTMTALAWAWFVTTLYNNMFPGQDLIRRLLLLGQMAALVVAGLAVDQVHGIDNRKGLVAYGLALAIVAALIVRGSRTSGKPIPAKSVAPLAIAAAICLLGALDSASHSGYYLVAALLASLLPILLTEYTRWNDASMIRLEHLRERLGLFVLIILGEGFAQLVSALHFLGAIPRSDIFALLFILSFAVWWIYFDGTFSEHTDLAHVRWRLTLLAHLTLVFGLVGTLDILILLTSGQGGELGDAMLTYFVGCLSVVLFSFAALGFTAKGRLGIQGWTQVACGILIVGVGLVFVPQDDTSTLAVIGLSAAIVIGNAVIAVWADVAGERHQWRSTLGIALGGRGSSRDR